MLCAFSNGPKPFPSSWPHARQAADYKGIWYTHREHVSLRQLSKLNPGTGKVPVVRSDGEVVFDSTLIQMRCVAGRIHRP